MGPKVDSIPLSITQIEFNSVLKGKMGENIIINLTVEGKEDLGSQVVMIRDFQVDLIKRDVIHIDLRKLIWKRSYGSGSD
jgi:ribosomal protein L25 (general stress protein Ctc)